MESEFRPHNRAHRAPVSWTEHAVAEFGERPQAILNGQIVEEADLAVALFRDRLGTPTGEVESDTSKEIKLLVKAGKPVAVLMSAAPRLPLMGNGLQDRQRLEAYLEELGRRRWFSSTPTEETSSAPEQLSQPGDGAVPTIGRCIEERPGGVGTFGGGSNLGPRSASP